MKQFCRFILLSILLSACMPATRITGSWKNPTTPPKEYKTIFVAALTNNIAARSVAENDMETALTKHGLRVVKSINAFPPKTTTDSVTLEKVMSRVRSDGADAILTVSLVKKSTETRYVPGAGYNYGAYYWPGMRYGYYGRFGGYYNYWYPYMYDPGYYTQDDVYFMETNLYDAHTDELIWSAQSKTYNPSGLTPVSKEFAEIITQKMTKEGVLKGIAKK